MPAYASPCSAILAWIVIGLILAAAVTAWTTEIPTYARGVAEMARSEERASDSVRLVGFVDAAYQSCVEVGQPAFLNVEASREHVSLSVVQVESRTVDAASLRQRFRALQGHGSDRLVVVRLRLKSAKASGKVRGTRPTYPVEIEIGKRRMASMLPWIGSMLTSSGPCH